MNNPETAVAKKIQSFIPEAEKAIKELKSQVIDLATYYEKSCSGCSLCNSVCPAYRALRARIYSPRYRLKTAVKVLLGKSINEEEFISLFSCLLCGLCSVACPYGFQLWLIIAMARYELARKGLAPRGLREVAVNAARYGHSFTTSVGQAVQWARKKHVAVDTPAEFLYIPSPLENVRFPQKLYTKTLLLSKLGVNYTVSSIVVDLGGNPGIDASRIDLGIAMAMVAVEEAEKLGSKKIIISECGSDLKLAHTILPLIVDYTGVHREAFIPIHKLIVKRLGKQLESIGTPRQGEEAVLFASCNFSRFTSYIQEMHRFVKARLPPDKPPFTSCCGGGGGLSINTEQWARSLRRRISYERLRLLRLKEPSIIVVPCIKCYATIREATLIARMRARIELLTEHIWRLIN